MKLEGLTILVVSNEPWGDLWFSKHQYAFELSKRNRVIFLDPPEHWAVRALFGPGFRLEQVQNALSVVRYRNVLPRAVSGPAFGVNSWLIARGLGRFLRNSGNTPDVILTFDPFRPLPTETLGATRQIYYVVDPYAFESERSVIDCADTILVLTPELAQRYSADFGITAHVVPHGVADHGIPEGELLSPPIRREVLACGTFGYRTDYGLLVAAARRFPQWTFRFVGPVLYQKFKNEDRALLSELQACPNVVFTGTKPYFEMGREILAATVCLCPYKDLNFPIWASSALKTIQYLSFGRPVISTIKEDVLGVDPRFVQTARDLTGFLAQLDATLSTPHDAAAVKARLAFAQEFAYPKLIRRIEEILENGHSR